MTAALTAAQRDLAERYFPLACKMAAQHLKRFGGITPEVYSDACVALCHVAAWYDPDRIAPNGKPYNFAAIAKRCIGQHLRREMVRNTKRPSVCQMQDDVTDHRASELAAVEAADEIDVEMARVRAACSADAVALLLEVYAMERGRPRSLWSKATHALQKCRKQMEAAGQ